jgi:molybdate transport system substrate-binding protein
MSDMSIRLNALRVLQVCTCALLALLAAATSGRAAELTFLADVVLQSAMEELMPEFEKASGHTVKALYATSAANTERVRKGERADLAIVSAEQWDGLRQDGKLSPGSRVIIARTGIAVFVKKGAQRPSLASVDDVKRALLGAGSIAVAEPSRSPVGRHVVPLLDRLGIAAAVKPRLRLAASDADAIEAVAKGEAQLGLAETIDIMVSPDVQAAGPLPSDIQSFTTFAAAVPAGADQAAAKSLVDFLLSPPAVKVLKAMGLECGITAANIDQPFSCFLGPPGAGLQVLTRGVRPPAPRK